MQIHQDSCPRSWSKTLLVPGLDWSRRIQVGIRTASCPWLSWCSRIQSCTRCCPRSRTQPSAFLWMHVERADIFVSHLSRTIIVGWPETFMKVHVKGSRPILDAPRIVCTPSQTCLHVINLRRLSQIRVHIYIYDYTSFNLLRIK